jgi:hypothetical protein
MNDIRAQLMRSKTVPQVNRTVTKSLTVHWNGPGFTAPDLVQLQGDARFHVQTRGWDGLSYHYGVGRDAQIYWCRDAIARLNHAGVAQGNSESLSVLVLTGEGMSIPSVQISALESLIVTLKMQPRYVLGHQEWPRLTACPGPLLLRWLTSYRARYITAGSAYTITNANVRDEASVLSHKVKELPMGTRVTGNWVLGKPFKGDCQWFRIGTDYIHASTLRVA